MDNTRIYTVRLTFNELEPEIWREFKVPENMYLGDMHKLIQTMGCWTNSHLHCFIFNKVNYTAPELLDDDPYGPHEISYEGKPLYIFLLKVGDKLEYCYDYGDNWRITLELKNIEEVAVKAIKPVCLDGANEYPPENCGGLPGYKHLLQMMKKPKSEEFKEFSAWIGLKSNYDPTCFDKDSLNKKLSRMKLTCIDI